MVKDLKKLVAVPSVLDESSARPGAPFGENNRKVLDTFLAIAGEMGMETVDYNGYAGEVTLGHGEKMVGILGHLDVVEAGAGWNTEPFQMTQREETVFGRGVSDEQGAGHQQPVCHEVHPGQRTAAPGPQHPPYCGYG